MILHLLKALMLLSTISIENEVAKISFNGLINEFAEK